MSADVWVRWAEREALQSHFVVPTPALRGHVPAPCLRVILTTARNATPTGGSCALSPRPWQWGTFDQICVSFCGQILSWHLLNTDLSVQWSFP